MDEEIKDGARREVFEETGIKLKSSDMKFLTKGFTKYLFSGKKFIIYGVAMDDKPSVKLDSELTDFAWVPPDQISKYKTTNEVKASIGT